MLNKIGFLTVLCAQIYGAKVEVTSKCVAGTVLMSAQIVHESTETPLYDALRTKNVRGIAKAFDDAIEESLMSILNKEFNNKTPLCLVLKADFKMFPELNDVLPRYTGLLECILRKHIATLPATQEAHIDFLHHLQSMRFLKRPDEPRYARFQDAHIVKKAIELLDQSDVLASVALTELDQAHALDQEDIRKFGRLGEQWTGITHIGILGLNKTQKITTYRKLLLPNLIVLFPNPQERTIVEQFAHGLSIDRQNPRLNRMSGLSIDSYFGGLLDSNRVELERLKAKFNLNNQATQTSQTTAARAAAAGS